mmetsp:Transcript_162184/g.520128  ORF Transcript_162184/g.520128 Transcript_162184/m.520128 type:complete len:433 (-) Transcript_162184:749-2047(-)
MHGNHVVLRATSALACFPCAWSRLWISVTVLPSRLEAFGRDCLPSLLAQEGVDIEEVLVVLPLRFRDLKRELGSPVLRSLAGQQYRSPLPGWLEGTNVDSRVRVLRPSADLGTLSKLLPAVEHMRRRGASASDALIVVVDDTRYQPGAFANLHIRWSESFPGAVLAAEGGKGLRSVLGDGERPGHVEWVQQWAGVRYPFALFLDGSLERQLQCPLPPDLRTADPDHLQNCPPEALGDLDWWISGWLEVRGHSRVVVPGGGGAWAFGSHDSTLPDQLSASPLSETRKRRIAEYFSTAHGTWTHLAKAFARDAATLSEGSALAQALLVEALQSSSGPATGQAEVALREAVIGCERLAGADHPATLGRMRQLALFLRKFRPSEASATAEAETLLQRAATGLRVSLGDGHPDVQRARANLQEVQQSLRHLHLGAEL